VHAAQVLSTINNQYITPRTVRNALKATEMIVVSKQKKPLLTRKHRRARSEFAERHLEWTVDDWKRVWWSDMRDQVWVDKKIR